MIHGKSFKTSINNISCDNTYHIKKGLQQGTVTSPILFNLYNAESLNKFDMNTGNNTHSIAFADDVIIYVADNKIEQINEKLNKLLNETNKHYLNWNLKINPAKCESILFRKTVNEIPFTTVQKLKTFKLSIKNTSEDNITEEFIIPQNEIVRYLGVYFDYLIRMNEHHKIQLNKARKAVKANSRIFYNTALEDRAKIICYLLLVRPVNAYAAPILWNTGPTIMEKYRKFERSCIKMALGIYRTASSNYKRRINNKIIYNLAKIPRYDNFIIQLTRNYFANIKKVKNTILDSLECNNEDNIRRMLRKGYIPPEIFTYIDNKGFVQNAENIPILYHAQRHRAKKAIFTEEEKYRKENLTYSTTIPDQDYSSTARLNKDNWWLQNNAKYIDEIRRRAKRRAQSVVQR